MSDRDVRHATAWLGCHGLWEATPTPLLVARLAVRRRSRVATAAAGVLLVAAFLAAHDRLLTGGQPTGSPSWLLIVAVTGVTALMIRWLGMRWVMRVERRLAGHLPVRVADPVNAGWATLLGRRRWLLAALYVGTVAIVVAAAGLGDARTGAAAGVVLAAIVAFVALDAVDVAGIVRRPTLAEDDVSLRVDAALRREDVHASSSPALPVILAGQLAGRPDLPDWLSPAALAVIVLLVPDAIMHMAAVRHAARPVGRPTPTPQS